jgi:alkylation response protein AidB-like acyl-CoA dehydrogenase
VGNFFQDNADLHYYVDKGIDWATLVRLVEPDMPSADGPKDVEEAVASYRDIMELMGQFTADHIAPQVAAIDRAELQLKDGKVHFPPQLDAIFEQIKEMGLHGMCLPREVGGMNCPLMLHFLTSELIARADVSVMTHHGFHGAIALAMLLYSVGEQTTEFAPKTGKILKTRFSKEILDILSGDAWGCMDITEPDAGSDMAQLSTRATQAADGSWQLTGQKIFITSGHGKYHFVIARTDDVPRAEWTLEGLSLFLVRTYEDAPSGERTFFAHVDRLEEKLGHHASATCSIRFEASPAELIGKKGDGFKLMLLLMNNARLGVGFEALGLCESAHRLGAEYTAGRRSMGKTIDKHEMIADTLDEMRTDIQGIRALSVYGAFQEEIAQRVRLREQVEGLSDLEQRRLKRLGRVAAAKSRRVTPLVKYLAAEKAVEIARKTLQLHGGVGYTKEYGAEKLLRDALVTPIYEGTSQIQALMAMKDSLTGVIKNPQEFVRRVAQARWRSLSARDPLERRVAKVQSLSLSALQHLVSKTAQVKFKGLQDKPLSQWPKAFFQNWNPKRDFAWAMLHAERLTRMLADASICVVLLKQARQHPERRELLERYLERAETRCRFLHDEITCLGERLLSTLEPGRQTQDDAAQTA